MRGPIRVYVLRRALIRGVDLHMCHALPHFRQKGKAFVRQLSSVVANAAFSVQLISLYSPRFLHKRVMPRFVITFIGLILGSVWIHSVASAVPVPRIKPVSVEAVTEQAPVDRSQSQKRQPGLRYFDGSTPVPVIKPKGVQQASKPIIVIDPGHGGRDPGAIGVKGTQEKKITTQASKELAEMLRRTGRYQVVLTRSGDSYVEHDDRIRVARERQADLFISIHADSTANKNASGASVYTLADRAKNRSRRIVNNQNWILDVDLGEQGDPVGDILVDLAQRKTESQSDLFAEILLDRLESKTPLVGNSHRRAGYYVLLAPDVPAVLLELGFLSNAGDEKRLNSKAHRTKMLTAVVASIDEYMAEAR